MRSRTLVSSLFSAIICYAMSLGHPFTHRPPTDHLSSEIRASEGYGQVLGRWVGRRKLDLMARVSWCGWGPKDEGHENRGTLPFVGAGGFRTLYLLPSLWEEDASSLECASLPPTSLKTQTSSIWPELSASDISCL